MDTEEKKTAIITQSGKKITYEQLQQQIAWCAEKYEGAVRSLILLVCDNSCDNLILYLSCLWHKLPVILVGEQDADMVCKLLETFPVTYMWMPGKYHGEYEMAHIGEYGQYILYRDFHRDVRNIAVSDELALMLPTSGSEGGSKLVMLSYNNIEHNARSIIEALDIKPADRAAVMLPLCYSYGLSVVHTHLAEGATLLMPESPMISPDFWRFLEREQVTSLAGVPSVYELIRKLRILEGTYVFSDLRILTQSGGSLRPETKEYVLEQITNMKSSPHFAVMYGQTEATARISAFFLDEHREKLGSVGRVIPGGELWIEGDDPVGEICYKGGNVFLGYAEQAGDLAGAKQIIDHVLHTGDVGYLQEDGYLYLTGRMSRFAKVNGYRVGLDELQAELSRRLGREVFCVSIWFKEKEHIAICMEDCDVDKSGVEKVLMKNRKIAGCYRIKFLDSFPYKGNGKIDYEAMRKLCTS